MEIKLRLQHNGQQLCYLISPKNSTTYQAQFLNYAGIEQHPQRLIEIHYTGSSWQSDCSDAALANKLHLAIQSSLN